MPATVQLTENGRVLHYTFTDPWTTAEMENVANAAKRHYDAAKQKLHVLLDARKMRSVPSGVLRSARTNPDLRHPNSGRIAIVGATTLVQMFGETLMRLSHTEKAKFFKDEASAWQYLRTVIAQEDSLAQKASVPHPHGIESHAP